MPTYNFRHKETGEIVEKIFNFTQRDTFLESGEYEQVHLGAPKLVTHTGNIINKTSGDWKDLLKTVKKGAGRNSTIKT